MAAQLLSVLTPQFHVMPWFSAALLEVLPAGAAGCARGAWREGGFAVVGPDLWLLRHVVSISRACRASGTATARSIAPDSQTTSFSQLSLPLLPWVYHNGVRYSHERAIELHMRRRRGG